MITIRPAAERGATRLSWLDSRHTFSFGDYHDPEHVGFRHLRVINDDRIEPGKGFGPHPHRDMEIITYVLEGGLQHQDSMGNGSLITPGEVQRMSAGTGVVHSEINPSSSEPGHFLQIWIIPARRGVAPSYEQRSFGAERRGALRLVVAPDGQDGALKINQDARLHAAVLESGQQVGHALAAGRHAWVQLARGSAELNGIRLREGDGAAISDEKRVEIRAPESEAAEILLFDLA